MRYDDLDRVLSEEGDIVPSSGFVAAVMASVVQGAAAPPPIPFPWRRAAPGLVAWVLAVGLAVAALVAPSPAAETPGLLAASLEFLSARGAGWIVLSLVLSLVAVRVSALFAGDRP